MKNEVSNKLIIRNPNSATVFTPDQKPCSPKGRKTAKMIWGLWFSSVTKKKYNLSPAPPMVVAIIRAFTGQAKSARVGI